MLAPCADHPRQRWVALMLLAGLRSDEAAALTWDDIQGGHLYVRKHAGYRLKRGKERLVPLQGRLAEILGPAGTGTVAPLPGARSTVQMGRHFRAFLTHCCLEPRGRTPHSCRHTYGAMLIATGCPDILVKAYMGHESVATTADYAKAAPLHVEAVKGWGMGNLLP
jgi:integrase